MSGCDCPDTLSSGCGCGMAMTFNNDWFMAPILFNRWAPSNPGEVVGSMIAILFIAIIFRICTVSLGYMRLGVLRSTLVAFTAGLGYLAMLIAMTYIGWYFAAVIVGIFVGDLIANNMFDNGDKSGSVKGEEDNCCGC